MCAPFLFQLRKDHGSALVADVGLIFKNILCFWNWETNLLQICSHFHTV